MRRLASAPLDGLWLSPRLSLLPSTGSHTTANPLTSHFSTAPDGRRSVTAVKKPNKRRPDRKRYGKTRCLRCNSRFTTPDEGFYFMERFGSSSHCNGCEYLNS